MTTVTLQDAAANLSQLVEDAARGESVIIAKDGAPMVKMTPVQTADTPRKRRIGFMKGMFTTPDDFDTMLTEEIEQMFYGKARDKTAS